MICSIKNIPEINGIDALICFGVLFVVFVAIALLVSILRNASKGKQPLTEATKTEVKQKKLAPGSCGDLILKNVSEKEAAMVMAILAHELDTPLNRLQFISFSAEEVQNQEEVN